MITVHKTRVDNGILSKVGRSRITQHQRITKHLSRRYNIASSFRLQRILGVQFIQRVLDTPSSLNSKIHNPSKINPIFMIMIGPISCILYISQNLIARTTPQDANLKLCGY